MKPILDMSEHQLPSLIDYEKLAVTIDWVIIRVQYGDLYEDKHYQTHISQFQQLGIPINVYAWVRGINEADMVKEAEVFYQRAQRFEPCFWWLDIEERSMAQMVQGTERFRQRLKALGAQKVGAYIGNHVFHPFGYTEEAVRQFDGLWLPTYGRNLGYYEGANPTASSSYDLHQYTSNGRLTGYNGPLDLSRMASQKNRLFYTGGKPSISEYQVGDRVEIRQVYTSSESQLALKPLRNRGVITEILQGKRNPYLLDNGQLGWVNLESIVKKGSEGDAVYVVQKGETLWGIGQKLGRSWQELVQINQLTNPDLIYPGQPLRY